jgi:hypothetical protein
VHSETSTPQVPRVHPAAVLREGAYGVAYDLSETVPYIAHDHTTIPSLPLITLDSDGECDQADRMTY